MVRMRGFEDEKSLVSIIDIVSGEMEMGEV